MKFKKCAQLIQMVQEGCTTWWSKSNRNTKDLRQDLKFENCGLVLRVFYVMQKHLPTPPIMKMETSTVTSTTFTPNYEHPTRRREILKSMKHYDTEWDRDQPVLLVFFFFFSDLSPSSSNFRFLPLLSGVIDSAALSFSSFLTTTGVPSALILI